MSAFGRRISDPSLPKNSYFFAGFQGPTYTEYEVGSGMNDESKEINVNARQLMGLLEQAELGCHALFEHAMIRRALTKSKVSDVDLDDSTVEEVQEAIVHLAGLSNVIEQRKFIDDQPNRVQNLLIHMYFRFLDQFMQRRSVTLH